MEAVWNRMHLERPPNASCYIKREKFDSIKFQTVLEKAIKDLSSQELLHKEAAILSRLIYRMKSKFRNDKGVKEMFKVNRALLNYVSISLEKEYENLRNYIDTDDKYVKLPSKQMVQYVLVRTQGFAKLMIRVEETSKHAAHFLKKRIGLGHAWTIAIVAYAVICRIWILSRHLIKRTCTWYNDLYEYLKLFKACGLNWLPKEYETPSNLDEWLALPWIDEPTPNVPSNHGLGTTMFKLITLREYDSEEDIALDANDYSKETDLENITSREQEGNVSTVTKNEKKNGFPNDDTGEVIDRRAYNLIHTKPNTEAYDNDNHQNKDNKEIYFDDTEDVGTSIRQDQNVMVPLKKKHARKLLTIDNVNNKRDLTELLNKESYPGLDKLQWNMIRNKSKKQLNKLDACSDEINQSILFKKVIKRIHRWLTYV
ncbi:uncharacterized protein LOC128889361 isoform X1 [Hylaeus anthracinus]|uniref:uncharacterized protein LOC128889361 isoform X1 n=1 Tax=Hylaeus anthracinus TaxID=313031 RepID=UPI0023B8A61F|nr:uncharacterized protein LOC128889361 isoform X1 [Hylaeus anthracinus]